MDPVREFLKRRGCAEHVVQGGLARLVESWERVVESVKRGYNFGLDDYLNDMDGRQLLEEALQLAKPKQSYVERTRGADEAMLSVVRPTGRCLWGKDNASEHGWSAEKNWWYFAVPINAGSELTDDLKEEE
ncbi:MAG: hypothetical protein WAU45_11470 [Blastocatellia bacterium]